jgi:hypothetical protein
MDLLETVQKNLGYGPLKKVDPNTQEIIDARKMTADQKLAQAAIPAVLAALIKYSDGPEGINIVAKENDNWLNRIYNGKEDYAAKQVAEYAGVSEEDAAHTMEKITKESVSVVRQNVKHADAEKLRSYMNSQRHSILNHLPAVLKMGDLLNEESFDDRTNKMEGPVSSFMHRIENLL